jgi:hypothetical protein
MYTLRTLYCLISIDMFYTQMQLIAETGSMEWIYMYVSIYVCVCVLLSMIKQTQSRRPGPDLDCGATETKKNRPW